MPGKCMRLKVCQMLRGFRIPPRCFQTVADTITSAKMLMTAATQIDGQKTGRKNTLWDVLPCYSSAATTAIAIATPTPTATPAGPALAPAGPRVKLDMRTAHNLCFCNIWTNYYIKNVVLFEENSILPLPERLESSGW